MNIKKLQILIILDITGANRFEIPRIHKDFQKIKFWKKTIIFK